MIEVSKKVGPWRAAVNEAVSRAWIATADSSSFSDPVEIRATFYLPRPKTVKRLLPSVPPDLDKLERGLFDALTLAGAWADDSLVVRSQAAKLYADKIEDAGVRVSIRTIDLADQQK
jgi:Holliday junction resolvase RusA-like endonuclease